MTLRRLLNVTYAHIMKGRNASEREEIETILNEKRYEDMTPKERERAERKRVAIETGAYRAQSGLVGAMGMPQGRRRPGQ